ncbi:hypothetical protein B0T14DRAFT_290899 [Immersiella caudata]|uniref:Uncharacterized protein n=1 Tax=Immersiella caudata TaxID=314043 RepID=A0AA39WEK2_9PEZI|nr:hypothetical protein B0T14DRAFT_290899 [Immersiella caudata]
MDTVLSHVDHVRRLELLALCYHQGPKDPRWPSWVPDFRKSFAPPRPFTYQFASGYSRSWTSYSWDAKLDRHLLMVSGVQCATVTETKKISALHPMQPHARLTARQLEPDETAASKEYLTGESFGIAHAKTMNGNYLDERIPALRGHDWADLETWQRDWKRETRSEHVVRVKGSSNDSISGLEAASMFSKGTLEAFSFINRRT